MPSELERHAAGLIAAVAEGVADRFTRERLAAARAALDGLLAARARLAKGDLGERKAVQDADNRVVGMLLKDGLAGLAQDIVKGAPSPGRNAPSDAPENLLDAARLFRDLAAYLVAHGRESEAGRERQRVAKALVDRLAAYGDATQAALDSQDYPDLPGVSLDLSRCDVLAWVAEEVGAADDVERIRFQARRLSRLVLRRATRVIELFLERGDLDSRFDLAGMTTHVDEMIVLVARVLDAVEEERTPDSDPFVETVSEQVVSGFVEAVQRLVGSLLRAAQAAVLRDTINPLLFQGLLKQIEKLVQVSARLAEGSAPAALGALVAAAKRDLLQAAAAMAGAAAHELDKPQGGDRIQLAAIIGRGEAVIQLMARLGWAAEVEKSVALFPSAVAGQVRRAAKVALGERAAVPAAGDGGDAA